MLNITSRLKYWANFQRALVGLLSISYLLVPLVSYADGAPEKLKPITVVVKKIRRDQRSIPIDVSGRLHNKIEIKLAFKTGGLVDQVLVDEGDYVEEGQLLARLDLEEVEAAVAQAEAAYQKAKRDIKRVASLNKQNVLSKQKLQDAETELTLRRADLKVAKFNQKYSEIRASVAGYILRRELEVNELVQPSDGFCYGIKKRWLDCTGRFN